MGFIKACVHCVRIPDSNMAQFIITIVLTYIAIGLLFAVAFVSVGIGRIDPAARSAKWSVRLILVPGSVALWPLLAFKWLTARGTDHAA